MVRHSLQSQAVRSGKTAKERLIQMMLEEHTQSTTIETFDEFKEKILGKN